jgi:ABC-2 type transport system ATP-binding protein
LKALSLRGLRKQYKNGPEALKGIDLDVEEGAFFALLGPNGAGKSTAIGIISSLVNKTAGTVEIFGHDLDTHCAEAKSSIGIVPQEFNFNVFETTENVLLNQAGYYGLPRDVARVRAEKYLRRLDLWDRRATRSRELSGGMKRRLMIARALVHEPPLLILDEPTAGVDIEIRRAMWAFLTEMNEAGTTIILTTHYLEEAESLCREIAIINHGEIVERADTQTLLARLHTEVFVLDLKTALEQAPGGDGFTMTLRDAMTLEVAVPQGGGLNRVFAVLGEAGVEVRSMRNKSNRLEQLFLNLVDDGEASNHGDGPDTDRPMTDGGTTSGRSVKSDTAPPS